MGAVELWGTSGDGTRYLYDNSKVHIWREMTANLEPDIYPSRKYDFDTLMFCFGAEPVPAQGGHSRRRATRIWGGAGFGCALAVAYGHSRARQTPGLEQSRGVDSARVGMAGGPAGHG